MKDSLKFFKIGEVAEIFAGGDKPNNFNLTKTSEYQIPVFANGENNKGLQGFTDKARVIQPAVTISARGTIGYTVLRDEPFVPIVRLLTLIPDNEKIDLQYLYYYLTLFRQTGLGSSQAQLTVPDISDRKILIPDLPKQKEIGRFLSLLDKQIDLNNKINNELEKIAKTFYDYWFVQFDFPDENGKPYKSSGGEMVWSEDLKREVPKEWAVTGLYKNSLTSILKPKIDIFEGSKEYLATANINGREIIKGDLITYENRESRANMQPVINSVWFAKMKASKKHIFVGKYSKDIIENNIFSTGFLGLKCEDFAFEYIASFISSDIFELTKDIISHGATMQGIGNDDLKLIKLVIPNKEVLTRYKKITEDIYKKMDLIRRENQKLIEVRDFLLPMLMNGQVSIK